MLDTEADGVDYHLYDKVNKCFKPLVVRKSESPRNECNCSCAHGKLYHGKSIILDKRCAAHLILEHYLCVHHVVTSGGRNARYYLRHNGMSRTHKCEYSRNIKNMEHAQVDYKRRYGAEEILYDKRINSEAVSYHSEVRGFVFLDINGGYLYLVIGDILLVHKEQHIGLILVSVSVSRQNGGKILK